MTFTVISECGVLKCRKSYSGTPLVKVVLIFRESGSKTPCTWCRTIGIYIYSITSLLIIVVQDFYCNHKNRTNYYYIVRPVFCFTNILYLLLLLHNHSFSIFLRRTAFCSHKTIHKIICIMISDFFSNSACFFICMHQKNYSLLNSYPIEIISKRLPVFFFEYLSQISCINIVFFT